MSESPGSPVLDLDRADLGLAEEASSREGGGGLKNCFACGACSASCPVLPHVRGYDPRRIIRLVLLGQRERVLREETIWFCATCFSCQEVCPQGVNFAELSFALKNLAVAAGHFPPPLLAQVGLLREQGRLYPVGEFENQKRADLDLPPVGGPAGDCAALLEGLAGRLQPARREEA